MERIQNSLICLFTLKNDANAAALGEAYSGATKRRKRFNYDYPGYRYRRRYNNRQKIYAGYNGNAAELGRHTVIVVDGETCSCGRPGCWEAYASRDGSYPSDKGCRKNNPDSILAQLAADGVNGKTVFDAKRKGAAPWHSRYLTTH